MDMSVSESDEKLKVCEDNDVLNELFICSGKELRVKMQVLLCSLMWVHIVLHVKLGMILLQIIVIGYNMDVLLTRVLRIVKIGLG